MPGGDGRGPLGTGGGNGRGVKSGGGFGRGRMGILGNTGPEGYCECPNCGTKVKHQRGISCSTVKCPQCGSAMIRE